MRILITGATGQLGKNLVSALSRTNHTIILLVRDVNKMQQFLTKKGMIGIDKYQIHRADITDPDTCHKYIRNIDIVIHLAAIIQQVDTLEKEKEMLNVNFYGTLNVLKSMVAGKVRKLIFPSASMVYRDNLNCKENELAKVEPSTPYALSKVLAENVIQMYSRLHNIEYRILRCSYLYGLNHSSSIVNKMIKKVITNEVIEYGNNVKRDFLNTKDLIDFIITLLDFKGNDIINVGTGQETSISELIQMILDELGQQKPIRVNTNYCRDDKYERWRDSINIEKLARSGFNPQETFRDGIRLIINESYIR